MGPPGGKNGTQIAQLHTYILARVKLCSNYTLVHKFTNFARFGGRIFNFSTHFEFLVHKGLEKFLNFFEKFPKNFENFQNFRKFSENFPNFWPTTQILTFLQDKCALSAQIAQLHNCAQILVHLCTVFTPDELLVISTFAVRPLLHRVQ